MLNFKDKIYREGWNPIFPPNNNIWMHVYFILAIIFSKISYGFTVLKWKMLDKLEKTKNRRKLGE